MKLVINREKWYRGAGSYESKLLRPSDGKMCCLGFYCMELGYKKEQISGAGTPASSFLDPIKRPDWLVNNDGKGPLVSGSCAQLITTNDDEYISEKEREAAITAEFGENGVEVEFVGGEPAP